MTLEVKLVGVKDGLTDLTSSQSSSLFKSLISFEAANSTKLSMLYTPSDEDRLQGSNSYNLKMLSVNAVSEIPKHLNSELV